MASVKTWSTRSERREADAARDRFMATLGELRYRISPKTIASDTKDEVKFRAETAFADLSLVAREHRWLGGAIVATVVAAFVLRRRRRVGQELQYDEDR